MRNRWLVFVMVFLIVLFVYMVLDRRMVRRKRKRVSHRQRLDIEDLQGLFSSSRLTVEEFTEFLTYVERATEMPKEYLRPDDRFDKELAPARGWEFDDGLILLPEVLQGRFGGRVEDYDLAMSPKLADLLHVVESQGTSGCS